MPTEAGEIGSLEFLIPYVGDASLLKEAVSSVLRQDDGNWRLVVVEDGPQDAAVDPWLRGLGDPRITYRLNPTNLGVAGNFQACLEGATADHVVFLGCDDRLRPGYVSTIRSALRRHPEVAVVQPGVAVIDGAGIPTRPLGDRVKSWLAPRVTDHRVMNGADLLGSLVQGNWTYFPSLCWHREKLAAVGFRQDLRTVLDLAALAELILAGEELLVLPDVVFDYRRHASSASSVAAVRTDRFDEERHVLDEVATAARTLGWNRAARMARSRITSRLHAGLQTPGALARHDRAAAGHLVRHALGS